MLSNWSIVRCELFMPEQLFGSVKEWLINYNNAKIKVCTREGGGVMRERHAMMMQRQRLTMAMLERHELMMRRTVNRNAHVITPHGNVMAGRKGRTA